MIHQYGKQEGKAAYLVLADGTVFHGYSMGAAGETVGEVVFNTCTASYQSLLSDPTYYGQIVAQPTLWLKPGRGRGKCRLQYYGKRIHRARWYDTPCTGTEALRLMNICAGAILWEFVGSTRAG